MQIKNIRHTGIVVKDLKKMLSFYKNTLGLKEIRRNTEKGKYAEAILGQKKISVITVKLSTEDGQLVELLSFRLPQFHKNCPGIFKAGYTHISYSVDNIDSVYKKLKSKKIEFIGTPQTSPNGYAKIVFCKDPEDNFIELVEEL